MSKITRGDPEVKQMWHVKLSLPLNNPTMYYGFGLLIWLKRKINILWDQNLFEPILFSLSLFIKPFHFLSNCKMEVKVCSNITTTIWPRKGRKRRTVLCIKVMHFLTGRVTTHNLKKNLGVSLCIYEQFILNHLDSRNGKTDLTFLNNIS